MDLKRAHTVYAQNKSAVAIPSGNYYKIIWKWNMHTAPAVAVDH